MKILIFSLTLFILTSFSVVVRSQQPATTDAETLVQAWSFLEEKPLDDRAREMRAWAITYVSSTDDVTVVLCGGDLRKPLLDKKNKNSSELLSQYAIGMAAFKLRNPDKKDDENAAQVAGMESALKVYQLIIKDRPKTQTAGMDDLVAKRDKGLLHDLIYAENCGKK